MRTALLLPLLFAPLALAQEPHCTPQDTPRQCIARLVGGRADAAVQAAVAATNTGATSITSPSRSTLRDFVTTLTPYFDVATLSDGRKTFGFIYNLRRQAQFEATFPTPKVNPVLAGLIGDTEAKKAKQSLANDDDAVLALSFEALNRFLGRDLNKHRRLFDDLLAASLSDPAVALDTTFAEAGTDAAAFESSVQAAIPAAVAKLTSDFQPRLNNQPQWYGTGIYHWRNHLIGPSESSVALTLELGRQNLNSFYRNEGRDCGNSCAAAFERFVQRTQKPRGDRASLSVEYRARASVQLTTPAGLVEMRTPHRIAYVAAYSRPFGTLVSGKEGRLDFTYAYDGMKTKGNYGIASAALAGESVVAVAQAERIVFDIPRDRSTLAATYTQQLSDRISVPVALVWTDRIGTELVTPNLSPQKSYFREIREHRLTAQIGFIYKFPPVAPPSQPCCCP